MEVLSAIADKPTAIARWWPRLAARRITSIERMQEASVSATAEASNGMVEPSSTAQMWKAKSEPVNRLDISATSTANDTQSSRIGVTITMVLVILLDVRCAVAILGQMNLTKSEPSRSVMRWVQPCLYREFKHRD